MLDAPNFQTKRLQVQDWTADIKSGAAFEREVTPLLTPNVLAPLPPPLQLGTTTLAKWIAARASESVVCTIRLAENRALCGLFLLHFEPKHPTPTCHLGYLLAEPYWGQGLATELLAGLVDWFKNEMPGTVLMAGVATNNPTSTRVLVKNGFVLAGCEFADDVKMYTRIAQQ